MVDEYTVTEIAYKNGYEAGIKAGIQEFAKKLIEHYFYDLEKRFIFEEDIDEFVEKMTKK